MTIFLTQKDFRTKNSSFRPFFSQFVLFLKSNNSTSRNSGGTDAWTVPPPQIFWGDHPPVQSKVSARDIYIGPRYIILYAPMQHCLYICNVYYYLPPLIGFSKFRQSFLMVIGHFVHCASKITLQNNTQNLLICLAVGLNNFSFSGGIVSFRSTE